MNINWLQLYSAFIQSAKTSTDLGVVQEEGLAFLTICEGLPQVHQLLAKVILRFCPPWFSSNRNWPNLWKGYITFTKRGLVFKKVPEQHPVGGNEEKCPETTKLPYWWSMFVTGKPTQPIYQFASLLQRIISWLASCTKEHRLVLHLCHFSSSNAGLPTSTNWAHLTKMKETKLKSQMRNVNKN